MHILQVTHSYYPAVRYGGPIRSVAQLCKGLVQLGHEVEVCTTDSDSFGSVSVPTNHAVLVESVPVHYFHCPGWHYAGFSPQMEKWLGSHIADYDLVHIQGVWTFPQRYAAREARKHSVPYIISPRGMADQRIAQKRFTLGKWLYINLYDRTNLRQPALFHYTSPGEQETSLFHELPPASCVVPNPVTAIAEDSKATPSQKMNFSSDFRYILVVGRIAWTKNIDLLIRALKQIGSPCNDIHLVVAGPDTGNLVPSLRALAEKEKVLGRIRFVGTVNGQDLKELYRSALLVASPALSESFGNTIAEAIMEGTPVVATKASGISTFPELASCMSLCEPELSSLCDAIRNVIQERDLWQQRTATAKTILQQDFSASNIATRMAEAYKSILNTPP